MVVPQFWQAMTTVVFCAWLCNAAMSMAFESSATPGSTLLGVDCWPWRTLRLALLATRLLYAGQPLQPSAPPVPLHRPPPGQVPFGVWSAATYLAPAACWTACGLASLGDVEPVADCDPLGTIVGGRFRLVGRAAFLAFRYRPHALQMVAPWGDLRQRGVRLVPQLLIDDVRAAQLWCTVDSYLQT